MRVAMLKHPPSLKTKLKELSAMTIYSLYIKTHSITGLKYLGFTTKEDPHKYKGSGLYWNRHLAKHGVTYITEVIKQCGTHDEIAYWGLHYSKLFDIVYARDISGKKIWANTKPESGNGGRMSDESYAKAVASRRETGYDRQPETTAKINKSRKANGTEASNPAVIKKRLDTMKANGTLGNANSPEAVVKRIATRKARGNLKQTPESIAKMIATRKANGNHLRGPEVQAKRLATLARNKAAAKKD